MFASEKMRLTIAVGISAVLMAAATPQPRQSSPIVNGVPPEPKAEIDTYVDVQPSYYCVIPNQRYCAYNPPGQKNERCTCGRELGHFN